MDNHARERKISIRIIINLFIKNLFSILYFLFVGILLAVVYIQYIFNPSYLASGTINNNTYQDQSIMINIANTVKEDLTIEKTLDKMGVVSEIRENKKAEIVSKLSSNYNVSAYKVNITFSSKSKEEAIKVLDFIIDVTLERFFEANPSMQGKVVRQDTPIFTVSMGLAKTTVFALFVIGGAIFGVVIGVGTDLLKRRLYFENDVRKYELPYNFINLNRTKKETTPILESKEFIDGLVVLQDRLEGSAKRSITKVIGVVNLGYETYNALPGLLANNAAAVGLKTLIIDLDFEHPSVNNLYKIEKSEGITDILQNKDVKPLQVKDNLFVITTKEYAYPARFLKDERLKELIRTLANEFDYIFINVPVNDYYASLLFNFDLIDMLLINTSIEGTKMKKLDLYIENIEVENRNKLFLNTIDSKEKMPIPKFLKFKKKVK